MLRSFAAASRISKASRTAVSVAQKRFIETGSLAELHRQRAREKETIVKLMYNIGGKEEVDQYLNLFSSVESQKFAVVKVGGGVLENELDSFASSIAFLSKAGLTPIVVHGAGPQLNRILEAAKIEPNYNNGIRVTDPETLNIARRVFYSQNFKLVEALENIGVRARSVTGGVYVSDYLNKEQYGLVGKVQSVNLEQIDSCIRTSSIPVVSSLSETAGGQILNINADIAATEISKAIKPLKVVFINETGGLFNGETGERISVINLDEEYEGLMKQPWVKYGTKLKIQEIRDLLSGLPKSTTVSIISTSHLSKELFTSQGAGTLLRRGHKISKFTSLDGVDVEKLKKLFGGSSFMDSMKNSSPTIYADEDYQVGAIVLQDPGQVPVLSQFSASPEGADMNIREIIWNRIKGDFDQLCWVMEKSSPEKSWFFANSDGSFTVGEKVAFWYGLKDIPSVQTSVERLQNFGPFGSPFGQKRAYSTSASGSIKTVGMLGARGYVGQEVIKIIQSHPRLDLVALSSRELEGKPVQGYKPKNASELKYENLSPEDCTKRDLDCWIMALPNGLCKPFVDAIIAKNKSKLPVILDLGADYRFDSTWQYGFSERFREDIKKARLISNPGCYATGSQISVLPAAKVLGLASPPSVFGVSGYSGAGTKPSKNNDPAFLKDNLVPYSLINHIHEREVSLQVGSQIRFMPHVASWFQGITLTTSLEFKKPTTVDELFEIYSKYYQKDGKPETLIKVQKEVPYVKENSGKHHVTVGGFHVTKDGTHGVVVTTIDNLLKGAATQALQNINLALGFDELEGIEIN